MSEISDELWDEISQLRTLRKKELDFITKEREAKRQQAMIRMKMGRAVNRIQQGAEYGSSALHTAASEVGVSYSTLAEYARYYRFYGEMAAFRKWIAKQEEKDRDITWTLVREYVRRHNDTDSDEADQEKFEQRKRSVERKAQETYDEAHDLLEEAKERKDEEAVEMAAHALQSAQDSVSQVAGLILPKRVRVEDPYYIEWVKANYRCVVSGKTVKLEFHHLETGGTATKGSDYFGVPIHQSYHVPDLHGTDLKSFERKHDVNLYREALRIFQDYVSEVFIRLGVLDVEETDEPRESNLRRVESGEIAA